MRGSPRQTIASAAVSWRGTIKVAARALPSRTWPTAAAKSSAPSIVWSPMGTSMLKRIRDLHFALPASSCRQDDRTRPPDPLEENGQLPYEQRDHQGTLDRCAASPASCSTNPVLTGCAPQVARQDDRGPAPPRSGRSR